MHSSHSACLTHDTRLTLYVGHITLISLHMFNKCHSFYFVCPTGDTRIITHATCGNI